MIYQPKLYEYNNKDEVNWPNIPSDKNDQASSQKFRKIATSQSGPVSDGNEGVVHIPPAPALLEPHHQII